MRYRILTTTMTPYERVFLLTVLGLMITLVHTEPHDGTVVYRVHEEPSTSHLNQSTSGPLKAGVEFHGIGFVVVTSNGTLIDPSKERPDLFYANSSSSPWHKVGWTRDYINADDFPGRLNVNWDGEISPELKNHPISLSGSHFSLSVIEPLTGNACSMGNGGCVHTCSDINGTAQCSCPYGFQLQKDERSCDGDDDSYFYRYCSGGQIPIEYSYSRYYGNQKWVLVTPIGTIAKLIITMSKLHGWADFINIYDGDSLTAPPLIQSGKVDIVKNQQVIGTSNKLFIQFYRSIRGLEFSATLMPVYPVLLSDDTALITSNPLTPTNDAICLSVVYKLASIRGTNISVSARTSSDQEFHLHLSKQVEVGEWRIGRFKREIPSTFLHKPLTLSVSVVGKNSSLFSVVRCNPYVDMDVLELTNSLLIEDIPKPQDIPKNGEAYKCLNNGKWDSTVQKCFCPVGFTGSRCEEGCGSNRFGPACDEVCSAFGRGCQKIIFCRNGLPCTCAPGLKGHLCDIQCSPGEYGVGCQSRCGHCSDSDVCDPYTGRCSGTCKPGFYPPLCQETYKQLSGPPSIKSTDYTSVTVTADLSNTTGRGTPSFYQLQYKENSSINWLEIHPDIIKSNITERNITNLKTGVHYNVRVVLIDQVGDYVVDGIPVANAETLCAVPDYQEYNIRSSNINSTSFDIVWEFEHLRPEWCPLTGFDLYLQGPDRQVHHQEGPDSRSVSYRNLFPGVTYQVTLRAVTEQGKLSLSHVVRVTTSDRAPDQVINVKVVEGLNGELLTSWQPPRFTGGSIQYYVVEYQCLRLLACHIPCNDSNGHQEVRATSAVLSGLLPHAQYSVKVAGMAESLGPFEFGIAATKHEAPKTAPEASHLPTSQVTNDSLTFQWKASSNCSGFNGFFHGYRYELMTAADRSKVIQTGITTLSNATFTNLKPLTNYLLQVYVMTSAGWNTNYKLIINATTRPTTPDAVRELTVYKKGRRMIGLRWAPPYNSYGALMSFTVGYRTSEDDSGTEVRKRIEPVHCVPWPDLYCHTIHRLRVNTEYTLTVQARKNDVETNGSIVHVTAITREGVPGAPRNLKISNRTQSSLQISWEPPMNINGVLRSFLLSVEETDSLNNTDCCEYFPLRELLVKSEESQYSLEINGLRPATTVTISVSAKTVAIGSSVNITANTRPEPPLLLHAPEVKVDVESNEFSVILQPSDEYPGLDGIYLLLIQPLEEAPEANIWDSELSEQLREAVGTSFYLVGEYKQMEVNENKTMHFGKKFPAVNGTLGRVEVPELTADQVYQMGVALVLDYEGAKSVSYLASEPLTLD